MKTRQMTFFTPLCCFEQVDRAFDIDPRKGRFAG